MAHLRVAAVQSGVDVRWTPTEWANHLRWQLTSCREAQAQLVVFPAWTGAYQESYPRGFPAESLGTLLHLLGELAREACLHLVPGSMPVREEDGIKLRSFLLSPDGELLGAQDQLCPPPGYTPGRTIAPIPCALGRVGIIIERDGEVPEIGRILALQGADLFCAPSALPAPYNPWRQTAGLWQIVQANQVAAVEACLVGEMAGRSYAGCSRLLAVVEATPDGTGIVAGAGSTRQTEIVAGEIDLDAQIEARAAFPIFAALHRDLYRRTMPHAYRILASAGGGAREEGTRT